MLHFALRPSSATASSPDRRAMRGLISLLVLMLATFAPSLPAQDLPVLVGTVTKVIDGDTIDVDLESGLIRVRLHAIDTPERGQPGREATEALSALVAGKEVELEPFEQDSYDRLVARVYVGGHDVNATLIEEGHAWAFRQYMSREDAAYCALEHDARTQKRGIWALPPEQRIAPWGDDLDHLQEWHDQALALNAYLRGKELNGPMLGAQRRVEARIGQLLGEPRVGSPSITHARVIDEIPRNDRVRFRLLARGFGLLTDDEWRQSRSALLKYLQEKYPVPRRTPTHVVTARGVVKKPRAQRIKE